MTLPIICTCPLSDFGGPTISLPPFTMRKVGVACCKSHLDKELNGFLTLPLFQLHIGVYFASLPWRLNHRFQNPLSSRPVLHDTFIKAGYYTR
jgi:hypothetical protein